MWYPPEYFFNIADEMGMLIWQEHPVWQSPMETEYHAEYKRLFDKKGGDPAAGSPTATL